MEIVEIAAEFAPLAKVGGLADVLLGLSRALIEKEHTVEVILPKYDVLPIHELEDLKVILPVLPSYFDGHFYKNKIYRGRVRGVEVTLIEPSDSIDFFERNQIYGEEDDVDRFLYFCRAALEYLYVTKRRPDILHLHDWHAAAVAPLFRKHYFPLGFDHPKIVFTFHNLSYQGKCTKEHLAKVGIEAASDDLREKSEDGYNLLKGGILLSDCVTTVSPTYAKEVFSTLSFGLERALEAKGDHFSGILNGIDYDFWNPAKDLNLTYSYSARDMKDFPPFLEGKEKNKHALRKLFALDETRRPIVSSISRLIPQKGPELIRAALTRTLEKGGQFILLGSAMDADTKKEFLELKQSLISNRNVHIELAYNEKLSHLVFAASDLFVVPSLFEPCGLTQMIAMRYGAIPIVRRTGGLADTVEEDVNGFLFDEPLPEAIQSTMDRAFHIYFSHTTKWKDLMENALKRDFSWHGPADEYIKVFSSLIDKKAKAL